jgi:hypothetical protein
MGTGLAALDTLAAASSTRAQLAAEDFLDMHAQCRPAPYT